jgi:type II secretion system protein L
VFVSFAAPDAALLSAAHNQVTFLFDGGRMLVRSIEQAAAIEAGALKLVLESVAAKAPTEGIRIVAVNGRVPEVMRAEVAQVTEHPIEWIDTESDVTALAHLAAAYPGSPSAINLLQGTLAPTKQGANGWIRWRAVAALLALWFVVLLASETVRGAWAAHRASALTSDIEALYRSYFPQDRRVQDPYKQMRVHLGGRADSNSTFLSLLGHLASGLAANPSAQLRSITFSDARAELGAEVAVGGFDALESLKTAWGKEGVAVDISSAEQQDQQVRARIRLRGG